MLLARLLVQWDWIVLDEVRTRQLGRMLSGNVNPTERAQNVKIVSIKLRWLLMLAVSLVLAAWP